MLILFLFIFGTAVGSFLNVLIDRIPREEKITGRSHCEFCKKELKWYDLIPLLSFSYLKGKCRYCRTKLSLQYPLIELLTGLLFVSVYLSSMVNGQWSMVNNLIYHLLIVSSLIVIFFIDLKDGIIPDRIVFPAIAVSLVYLFINPLPATQDSLLAMQAGQSLIISHVLAGFGAFVFFLAIFLITKGKGMGFGDVKFSFLLGLVLGPIGAVIALYVAFLTGGFIGLILILWKKKELKSAIPFGPFLVFGTLISLFFSQQIIPVLNAIF